MKKFTIIILALFTISSCSKTVINKTSDCKEITLLQDLPFENTGIYIESISISDNCLDLLLGFSGCDDNHEIDLITTFAIAESNPPQLALNFKDHNPQFCEAYFNKNYSFDLAVINRIMELHNTDKIWLNFIGSDKKLLYEK